MSPPARRPAWAARHRAAACAVVAAALGLAPALPLASAHPGPPGYAVHPPVPGLRVVLDDVAPTVPRMGEPVVLRGRVVNGSATQLRVGHVSVEASWTPLSTRDGVTEWVSAPAGTGTEWFLGLDAVGPVVAAGSEVPFAVTVPEDALVGLDGDRAVLGLEVLAHAQEEGVPGLVQEAPATLRTVLAVDRGTEVEQPLETSWLVPLTLPPDPDLTAVDDARWEAAWARAVGEGSAVRTWLDGLDLPGVTWVVDPALLAPEQPEALRAAEEPGEEPADGPGEEPADGPGEETSDDTSEDTSGATSEETSAATPTGAGQDDDGAGATTGPPGVDDAPATVAPPPGPTRSTGPTGPATVPPPGDGATTTSGPEDAPATEGPGDAPTDPGADLSPQERVAATVEDLREELAGLDEEQLWWLPTHDPDLAALLAGTRDEALLTQLVGRRAQVGEEARALLDRGRSPVAWPLLGAAPAADLARLGRVWQSADAGALTVVLPDPFPAGAAPAPVTPGALPLVEASGVNALPADRRSSALLAAAGEAAGRDGAGAAVQHVLADTLTAWAEDPSSAVVVAPSRGTVLPGPLLAELSDGLGSAAWLRPVPAESLLNDATAATPAPETPAIPPTDGPAPAEGAPDPGGAGQDTAYLEEGQSPLDAQGLRALNRLRSQLAGLRQVLVGPTAVPTWQDALTGAWSTRWRGEPEAWEASWRPLAEAGDAARVALHVNPGTVNFLADEGLMRVTIVNSLPVAVEDVRVRLVSSSDVLRIVDQPEPVAVGADSRATVTFSARAITRGQTTVTAELAAPNGTMLGDDAAVEVRVQPTGVWIYWVLGGIAGVVLVLGLGRALRSTPRAVLAGTRRPPVAGTPRPPGERPTTTTPEPS